MRVPDNRETSIRCRGRFAALRTAGCVVWSLLLKLPRVGFFTFVLALPIGYYPENPDSTDTGFGVHAGRGQVASVLRNCDGNALHSEGSQFEDVSASAWMAVPPGRRSPLVLGLRGGRWQSDKAGFAVRRTGGRNSYGRSPDQKMSFSYLNPSINLETRRLGLGVGLISGDVPQQFDQDADGRHNTLGASGHLRFGNPDKGYLAISVGENTPLISGGGTADVGVGFAAGRFVRLYTGLCGGFYESGGFLQRVRVKTNRNLDFDVAFRFGSGGDVSESAISGGLTYRFGLGRRPQP